MSINSNIDNTIVIEDYVEAVRKTDRLEQDDFRPVLMGLFGEVGSIMAPAKKLHREKEAYKWSQDAVEEELGDTLWYFTALVRRTGHNLSDIITEVTGNSVYRKIIAASAVPGSPIIHLASSQDNEKLEDALLSLGQSATSLLDIMKNRDDVVPLLQDFARKYLQVVQASNVNFLRVINKNISKVQSRFLPYDIPSLPVFDKDFEKDERIPDSFEIHIKPKQNGKSYLKMNEVFIGDPLTDNISDLDNYRFHDVFHFAHAAILNWSPTFRALIKHKRKSNKSVEEAQDSGRAIVVEEGLTAWLYSRAKDLNYFEGQKGVSLELLKTINEFVRGYEVEACPLKLWEDAILQGYAVFRQVRDNNGGIVIGDRINRKISFKALPDSVI